MINTCMKVCLGVYHKTPKIKVKRLMGTFFFYQINGNGFFVRWINLVLHSHSLSCQHKNGLFTSWMADQWIMNHTPVALHLKHFNHYIFESQHDNSFTNKVKPTDRPCITWIPCWLDYLRLNVQWKCLRSDTR